METNFCELRREEEGQRRTQSQGYFDGVKRQQFQLDKKIWRELGHVMNVISQNKLLCVVLILLISVFSPVSGRLCTVLRNVKKIESVSKQEPCIQSYQAACGWFSSEQCTFYEHTYCERKYNATRTFYSIVTECCPGYQQLPNRTCIKSAGLTGELNEEEDDGIPHGVFAGIACGAVFIICITVLIILHVRKNDKKKIIMNKENVKYKDQKVHMINVNEPTTPAEDNNDLPSTDFIAKDNSK